QEESEAASLHRHGFATFLAYLLGNLRSRWGNCGLAVLHDNVLGISAFGITRAGEEKSESAALDGHGLAALFASLLGNFGHRRAHGRAEAILGGLFHGQIACAVTIRVTRAG